MATEARICPVCKQQTLVPHCGDTHPTCTWHMCRNTSCDAVLDLAGARGHCINNGEGKGRRTVDLKEKPA